VSVHLQLCSSLPTALSPRVSSLSLFLEQGTVLIRDGDGPERRKGRRLEGTGGESMTSNSRGVLAAHR
jgi:hypothetical protein